MNNTFNQYGLTIIVFSLMRVWKKEIGLVCGRIRLCGKKRKKINNLNSFKNLYRRKFNIITASSGQQGLEILEAQPIQVIITDQRMPSMKGLEFLKKVRDKWPDIEYILMTAYDEN